MSTTLSGSNFSEFFFFFFEDIFSVLKRIVSLRGLREWSGLTPFIDITQFDAGIIFKSNDNNEADRQNIAMISQEESSHERTSTNDKKKRNTHNHSNQFGIDDSFENRNRKQSSYHVLVVTPIEEKRKKINKYIRLDKTKAMFSSYN